MTKVRILVPFYNAAKTLPRLIESLEAQTDQDFDVLFLNDASKDNSRDVITEAYADVHHETTDHHHYVYKGNADNIGIMQNVVSGVAMTDDDVVCCICDGDDYLFPHAVETVKRYYDENDIDFAWSNFVYYPSMKPGFCKDVNRKVSHRLFYPIWSMSHMRTWRAGVFKSIDYDKKFKWQGEWFNFANDLAIMMALQEVTDKYMYIPEHLYYHDVTEDGENTTRTGETRRKQLIEETHIRSLLDDEDALVANQYYRHLVMLHEQIMGVCEEDPEFKRACLDKRLPVG